MRSSLLLLALLAAGPVLASAETWQGRLVDFACYEQQKTAVSCDPTGSTTMFALMISNKPYKLDDAGNSKAVEAFKNRSDRSTDPASAPATKVTAKITGTKESGDILKVETVELQ